MLKPFLYSLLLLASATALALTPCERALTLPSELYRLGQLLKIADLARSTMHSMSDRGMALIWDIHHKAVRQAGFEKFRLMESHYIHTRKHFQPTENIRRWSDLTINDQETVTHLRRVVDKLGPGKNKSVVFSDAPESAIAHALQLSVLHGDWSRATIHSDGHLSVDMTTSLGRQIYRSRLVICGKSECAHGTRMGDIITIYPICGPGVFEITGSIALRLLNKFPNEPVNALRAKPCL